MIINDCFRLFSFIQDICLDIVEFVPAAIKEVAKLMAEKDLRLRVPVEELDVLLEIEKEEDINELDQDPDIKDVPCPEENIQSRCESEDEFSDDSDQMQKLYVAVNVSIYTNKMFDFRGKLRLKKKEKIILNSKGK